jgi:hypothetical protein
MHIPAAFIRLKWNFPVGSYYPPFTLGTHDLSGAVQGYCAITAAIKTKLLTVIIENKTPMLLKTVIALSIGAANEQTTRKSIQVQ